MVQPIPSSCILRECGNRFNLICKRTRELYREDGKARVLVV